MKNPSVRKKFFIIITLVVLVVGMVLLGVLGFNKTVDGKPSYEVRVNIDFNVNNETEDMQRASEMYFSTVGVNEKNYAKQILNEGCTVIYKFDNDVTEKIDVDKLIGVVETSLNGSGAIVTADVYEVVPLNQTQPIMAILGAVIAVFAIFVYMYFIEKTAGALTSLFVMALSALLFVAMLGITRLPTNGFSMVFGLCSAIFGGILSSAIATRLREELKNEGNSKLSYNEIADKAMNSSRLRLRIFALAIAFISILLIALGSGLVRFYGVYLMMSGFIACFVSVAFTGLVWASIKNLKKDKRAKINNVEQEQSVEA